MTKQHLHVKWNVKTEQTFVLNLDKDFIPFKDHSNLFFLDFKKFSFPGGEQHFQILSNLDYVGNLIITHRVNSAFDFMDILLATDAAKRAGFKDIKLVIPYFPAARQDRVCNAGEPLTVKVFADLINGCGFSEVFIYAPHSEVTPALLDNVTVVDNDVEYFQKIINEQSDGHHVNIVCPDAGAGKRVGKLTTALANADGYRNYNMVRCEKVRDVKDGSIKEFFVGADDLGGHLCIISDDINSKGGTFIGLGKKLRERNCGKLILFTSHSDCVEGIENVTQHFDEVYTTNSKLSYDTLVSKENFHCIKFEL